MSEEVRDNAKLENLSSEELVRFIMDLSHRMSIHHAL